MGSMNHMNNTSNMSNMNSTNSMNNNNPQSAGVAQGRRRIGLPSSSGVGLRLGAGVGVQGFRLKKA